MRSIPEHWPKFTRTPAVMSKVKVHTQSLYVYIFLKHTYTWTDIHTSILLLIVSSSQPASPGSSSNPQTRAWGRISRKTTSIVSESQQKKKKKKIVNSPPQTQYLRIGFRGHEICFHVSFPSIFIVFKTKTQPSNRSTPLSCPGPNNQDRNEMLKLRISSAQLIAYNYWIVTLRIERSSGINGSFNVEGSGGVCAMSWPDARNKKKEHTPST